MIHGGCPESSRVIEIQRLCMHLLLHHNFCPHHDHHRNDHVRRYFIRNDLVLRCLKMIWRGHKHQLWEMAAQADINRGS